MVRNLSAWHVLVLLVVVVLLFGANRLPDLAKSVGQSLKIFKSEIKDLTDDGQKSAGAASVTPPVAPVTSQPAAPASAVSVDAPPAAPAAPTQDSSSATSGATGPQV